MLKKNIHTYYTILFCFSIGILRSQAPTIQWKTNLGGSDSDEAKSIYETDDGNYIITGNTFSNNNQVSGYKGYGDFWIVKLNAMGSIIWEKTLGGSFEDYSSSIVQTNDGGYIVAGFSNSNDGDVSGNHGSDGWVAKLDSSGSLIWQKCIGGSDYDEFKSILQTSDEGFILVGSTHSIDGDVFGNNGRSDIWVVKLDEIGVIQWQKCIGDTFDDGGNSIQETNDGGFIVAGTSSFSLNYTTDYDGRVIKLDSTGNIIWDYIYGGISYGDGINSIYKTNDGNYIFAGYTKAYFYSSYWIVKINSNGNIIWTKIMGGSYDDIATSISQTNDGNYIIAGYSKNDGFTPSHHGEHDYWVVKINTAGSVIWEKYLGGSLNDEARCIIQTQDSGYIAVGIAASYNGDVSGSFGGGDYWVVKLSPESIITNIENSETFSFLLSPNPAKDFINISNNTEATFYEIYNLLGKKIDGGKTNQKINIQQLTPGMYFLKTSFGTKSFIVN